MPDADSHNSIDIVKPPDSVLPCIYLVGVLVSTPSSPDLGSLYLDSARNRLTCIAVWVNWLESAPELVLENSSETSDQCTDYTRPEWELEQLLDLGCDMVTAQVCRFSF